MQFVRLMTITILSVVSNLDRQIRFPLRSMASAWVSWPILLFSLFLCLNYVARTSWIDEDNTVYGKGHQMYKLDFYQRALRGFAIITHV